MPFRLDEFTIARPYLYHLTSRKNLQSIRQGWQLSSAEELMTAVGDSSLPIDRKRGTLAVTLNGHTILLRDQDPLYEGNIAFEPGWNFRNFIRHLNQHVFFWSGRGRGPNDYGERHFERYKGEKPVILRVKSTELFSANAPKEPFFCRYNSGSPRCSRGKKSPRGSSTFLASSKADFSASKAIEVVLRTHVTLPKLVQVAESPTGPWKTL